MAWLFKKKQPPLGQKIIDEFIQKAIAGEKINGDWVSDFDYFDNKKYNVKTEKFNDKLAFKDSLETLIKEKMKINPEEINSEEDIINKILKYKPKDEGFDLELDMEFYRLQYIIVKSRKINEPLSFNLLIYLLTYEYIEHEKKKYVEHEKKKYVENKKKTVKIIDIPIETYYTTFKDIITTLLNNDQYKINDFIKALYESLQNKAYGKAEKAIKTFIEEAYPHVIVIPNKLSSSNQELKRKLDSIVDQPYGGSKRSSKKRTTKRKHRKSRNTKKNRKRQSRR